MKRFPRHVSFVYLGHPEGMDYQTWASDYATQYGKGYRARYAGKPRPESEGPEINDLAYFSGWQDADIDAIISSTPPDPEETFMRNDDVMEILEVDPRER